MAITINHILIAAKNSTSSKSAQEIVLKISKKFNSKVTALLSNEAKTIVSNTFNHISVNYIALTGNAPKQIEEVTSNINPDLIILPIKHHATEDVVVSDKEANNIIEHLSRMVLTVPSGSTEFTFDKIVVPIDSSFETRQKVPYAEAFAKMFGSTIHIIGVSKDKGKDTEVTIRNYMRQAHNILIDHNINCVLDEEIYMGINPTDKTLEHAKKTGASLIVIMTEQENNLTSFFSGKFSEQMVKKSEIPVLSIHPKDLVVSEARL